MKGGCESRDGDLLMLAHGELDRWRSLRLRAHVAVCPRCRDRLRGLGALSKSLADALRNPSLGARVVRETSRGGAAVAGLLGVIVASLVWIAMQSGALGGTPAATASVLSMPRESCRLKPPPQPRRLDRPAPRGDVTASGEVWIEDENGRPHLVPKGAVER